MFKSKGLGKLDKRLAKENERIRDRMDKKAIDEGQMRICGELIDYHNEMKAFIKKLDNEIYEEEE